MQQARGTFADRLKLLRLDRKLSQEEMGKIMAVSRGAIGYYENLERTPDIASLAAVCEHFGVSADYMLGFTDVKTPSTDRRAVCEYTGLTEEAVELLEGKRIDTELLSFLVESVDLGFLSDLRALLEFKRTGGQVLIDTLGNIEPLSAAPVAQMQAMTEKYCTGKYYSVQTVAVDKAMESVLRENLLTAIYRLKGEFNPLGKE